MDAGARDGRKGEWGGTWWAGRRGTEGREDVQAMIYSRELFRERELAASNCKNRLALGLRRPRALNWTQSLHSVIPSRATGASPFSSVMPA